MPIHATIAGIYDQETILDSVSEHINEDGSGHFWLYSSSQETIGIQIKFPYKTKPNYNCADADVVILTNPFQGEADVLEVYLIPGSKRLGYSFSTNSAGSENHHHSSRPPFLAACHAAVLKTLEILAKSSSVIDLGRLPASCNFSDLFHDEITILAIHSPWLNEAGIEKDQLIADLFRNGYTLADDIRQRSPERYEVTELNFSNAKTSGQLKLRAMPRSLLSDGFIKSFLGKRVSCPDDPLLRFFYFYQIIERLLELEIREHSTKMATAFTKAHSDSIKIMNIFHDFKEALSEKSRIRTLFGERCNNALQNSPATGFFTGFLALLDDQPEKTPCYADLLYSIRNVVFHGWWKLPTGNSNKFQLVAAHLENDISELLISYAPPTDPSGIAPQTTPEASPEGIP